MPKIFISYGRDGSHGQNLATEAQQQLQAAGFEVFRDVTGLRGGDFWLRKLEQELRDSEIVVLVLSKKVLESKWVPNEINLAEDLGIAVIPLYAEIIELPLWLRHLQVLDFSIQADWEQLFDAAFSKVSVNAELVAPIPKPSVSLLKPECALRSGEDQFGQYADIQIQNVKQRFRFIKAGTFLMGSPASEAGRFIDEDQHLVTLTKGFWLGENAVTQAFWGEVMGVMPTCFTGEKHCPVYKVGWNEIQDFISQLNFQFEGLRARLPTEAQWEYSCRAGTISPYSFGWNVTAQQASYMDDLQVEKGEYQKGPVTVKSLPANAWGLYEMHGNVSEWCQDCWVENLGTEKAVDPVVKHGDGYVFRGGSWYYDARGVRSAARNHGSGDSCDDGIGFRLLVES